MLGKNKSQLLKLTDYSQAHAYLFFLKQNSPLFFCVFFFTKAHAKTSAGDSKNYFFASCVLDFTRFI